MKQTVFVLTLNKKIMGIFSSFSGVVEAAGKTYKSLNIKNIPFEYRNNAPGILKHYICPGDIEFKEYELD